jgi:hypothetical protein
MNEGKGFGKERTSERKCRSGLESEREMRLVVASPDRPFGSSIVWTDMRMSSPSSASHGASCSWEGLWPATCANGLFK